MTEGEILTGLGTAYLQSCLASYNMIRYAEFYRGKFGESVLERVEDVVCIDDAGQLKPAASSPGTDDALDTAEEFLGCMAAGYVLALRYLDRGDDPDTIRRSVIGRMRTLATAWACSPYDRDERLRECHKGIRRAMAEAG